MAHCKDLEADYQQYYALLFKIAYCMLGSASDAENVIQECYLRYNQASTEEIHSIKSYLSMIVIHVCLEYLKLARKKREQYTGVWLPEPFLTIREKHPAWQTIAQQEDFSTAFLILLEQTTPYERAVYLLREMFAFRYEEIARIIGKSTTCCRQLFHQAKTHIGSNQTHSSIFTQETQLYLVERFLVASQQKNMQLFIDILDQNVTWWADDGTKSTTHRPIHGREAVLQLLNNLLHQTSLWYPNIQFELATINGTPGILLWDHSTLIAAITCMTNTHSITELYEVTNPQKLGYIQHQMSTTS
jgi:RNA polymerase sigma-70 factor (ECF subfamily)